MGMNRKWNMKIFELHDSENQGGTTPEEETLPEAPPNDDVYIDTSESTIKMSKYPFTKEGMLPENTDPSSILDISLSDLTQEEGFSEYILDKENWHFRAGNADKLTIVDENQITFTSVVQAFLDLPTESTKWVLKFDLHTHPILYRSFFYFDGVDDENQISVRYQYGMDIPNSGYPHLETVEEYISNAGHFVEQTVADEQYFTGKTDMPVIVTRWNNIYTLYYDNRYMITVPTENDTLNRIGFWTWSSSNTYIKNIEFYVIEDDSEATNIIIDTNTSAEEPSDIQLSV